MTRVLFRSDLPVTLIGGSAPAHGVLDRALAMAPVLVAADGGADHALAAGHEPAIVIGDLDSISAKTRRRLGPDRVHRIAEQDSTDFDKCLRGIAAPFVLAVGFDGCRMDHALAAFNTLVRHPDRRCVILGGTDACFLAPAGSLRLDLAPGTRLSLFPLGEVTGAADGLRWSIDGIRFAPDGRIGTSNEVTGPTVTLRFDAARMLVIVPAGALPAVVSAWSYG